MKQNLENLLAEGKTARAIQTLLEITKSQDADLYKEMLQISARFAEYERQKRLNLADDTPLSIERNKINAVILTVIKRLPDDTDSSDSVTHSQTFVDLDKEIPHFLTAQPFDYDYFIGRDKDLEAIETNYQTQNRLLFLKSEESGIGKTSLASKYWHTHQNRYKHLAWLYIDRGIGAALISLATNFKIQFDQNDDEKCQIERIIEAINNLEMPCLLVFDNVNDADDLTAHYANLCKLSQCDILLTSRIKDIEGINVQQVLPLDKDDAVTVFKQYYKNVSDTDLPLLHAILKAVGYNTLVIEVMAKNLTVFNKFGVQYSLTNLLTDLQRKGLLSWKNKNIKLVHDSDILHTVEPNDILAVMYDLAALTHREQYVLSNMAVLPAENIPLKFLSSALIISEDVVKKSMWNSFTAFFTNKITKFKISEHEVISTLNNLKDKGWIKYNETDSSFKISPTIQELTKKKNAKWLLTDCNALINTLFARLNDENRYKDNFKQANIYTYWSEAVALSMPNSSYMIGYLYQKIGDFYKDISNFYLMLQSYQKMIDIYSKLCQENPDNENLKHSLAVSYLIFGETHSNLGNQEKALVFFEESNRLEKELYAEYKNKVQFKNTLAVSYLELGKLHKNLGNLKKALAFFENGINLFKELCAAYPNNVDFKPIMAISYLELGETHISLGNFDEALGFVEEYNHLGKKLYNDYPNNIEFKNLLANSYAFLGITHNSLGNLDKALKFVEECNRLAKELYATYPNNIKFKNSLAISYEKLGETHSSLGNLEKALGFYEEYNRLEKELYADYQNNVDFKNSLAISYEKLGQTHSSLGKLEKALGFFEEMNNLFKELYADYPNNVDFKNGLAISYYKLGEISIELKDKTKAKTYFKQAEGLWIELVRDAPQFVQFQQYLGMVQKILAEL